MFTKYPQTEIKKYWDVFKKHLEENLPPTSIGLKINLDEVFAKLMTDEMQMWIFINDKEEVLGFIVTAFSQELGFNFKNLVIYAAIATMPIDDNMWKTALSQVRDFAKKYECKRILAYTCNPRVLKIIKMLGGNTDFHLTTLEV